VKAAAPGRIPAVVQIAGESYRLNDKRRVGIIARPAKAKAKEDEKA